MPAEWPKQRHKTGASAPAPAGSTSTPQKTLNAKVSEEIKAAEIQAWATLKAARISKQAAIICATLAGAFGVGTGGTVAVIEAAAADETPQIVQTQPVQRAPQQPCHEVYAKGLDIAAKNPKLRRLIARPGKSDTLPFSTADLRRCPRAERLIEVEYGRGP